MFITPLIIFPVYLYFNSIKVHETHEQIKHLHVIINILVIQKEAQYIGNKEIITASVTSSSNLLPIKKMKTEILIFAYQ